MLGGVIKLKKIIGIFIMMLLIGTAIPTIGIINETQSNDIDYSNKKFVPGEFIVKFKEPPISCHSLNQLNEKYEVISKEKVVKNTDNIIFENIYKYKVPIDSNILSIIEEYSSLDNVVYAEPNGIRYLCGVPNDEFFEEQWSLRGGLFHLSSCRHTMQ